MLQYSEMDGLATRGDNRNDLVVRSCIKELEKCSPHEYLRWTFMTAGENLLPVVGISKI